MTTSRHSDDRPTIGLVLRRRQNRVIAEYTLRDLRKPMGIATFTLADALPEEVRAGLPTIEAIEACYGREMQRRLEQDSAVMTSTSRAGAADARS